VYTDFTNTVQEYDTTTAAAGGKSAADMIHGDTRPNQVVNHMVSHSVWI